MKARMGTALLVGIGLGLLFSPRPLVAQACKDEESMVIEEKKTFAELVDAVKKESLADFQKDYHQKTALNRLTFYDTMTGGLVSCLEKASQDTAALKEDVDAAKAKHDLYASLKAKIDHERDTLKATQNAKDAKALIEKSEVVK